MKRWFKLFAGAVALTGSVLAHAAIVFVNTGTAAPPAILGPFIMLPFDTTPQAAIADLTPVLTIPGSPVPGALNVVMTPVIKWTVPGPGSLATWSHGYLGPVFVSMGIHTATLTLPPNAQAFYLYLQPYASGTFNITVTTTGGGTSGPITVTSPGGANGFGFYTTAGETLSQITITSGAGSAGFIMGEFGIALTPTAGAVIPTVSEWMLLLIALVLGASALVALRRRGH